MSRNPSSSQQPRPISGQDALALEERLLSARRERVEMGLDMDFDEFRFYTRQITSSKIFQFLLQ